MSVRQQTRPLLLPNDREYCAELADSQAEMDRCTGDLEDLAFNSNRRSERVYDTVSKFAHRERLRRNPCGPLESVFNRKRCAR